MAARGEIDLQLEERLARAGHQRILERVAFTLGSTLDLKEVLRHLAEIVQEAASAQRCSIVLLEGNRLKPAVAIGAHPNEDLWSAFRSMPPIEMTPEQWMLLRRGRALAFEDARRAQHLPPAWVERFDLRAIVVIPLLARGEPCGVMALDWPDVRPIDAEELAMLEAVGTYAGLAVHNARLHERMARKSRTLEHLVDVASALNSSTSLAAVLDLICGGFETLLGAAHTSVNLVDPAHPLEVRTIATRGEAWFARDASSAHEGLPPEALLVDDELWRSSVGPVVYPRLEPPDGRPAGRGRTIESAALFPLFGADGLIGSVVAGFWRTGGPEPDELDTGQTLVELAATAITRADLHEQLRRRLRQLEVLSRLSDVVAGTVDLESALGEVNEALGPELGIHLWSVAVPNAALRAMIGGRPPDDHEMGAIRSWRSLLAGGARPVGLRQAGDDLLVPVVHRQRVQGALRVKRREGVVDLPDEEFLTAIGGACAEVLHRASLTRALQESERRLAVSAERERIAQDLHDSVGQLLTGMGLQLAELTGAAPDERWRERLESLLGLARRGEREIREAIYSLLFVQVREQGLLRSLEDLANRFESTTGISVDVRVDGEPAVLGTDREDALFRVVHEALHNAERHADATRIDVSLCYREDAAVLEVTDDGVGIADRTPGPEEAHFGLRALARRLTALDGTFVVGRAGPKGTVVRATVPTA